jgi:anaerobic magnesium-protoporphyrin IX monomethyl ester cyclase
MKVTFLNLPNWLGRESIDRVFGCTYTIYPFPHIFMLQGAALLKQNGFSAGYADAATEHWGQKKLLKFLGEDDSSAFVVHSINLSIETDLLSIKMIRSVKPNVPVIFVGPAPTYFSGRFLVDGNCFVVRGEPEFPMLELLQALQGGRGIAGIPGISFLRRGKVRQNRSRPPLKDLDTLPFPDRSLLQRDLYVNPKMGAKPWTAMLTSRGCSHRCIYCVPNSISFARELEFRRHSKEKPPIALRSAENVIREFRQLAAEGYKAVSIIDDQFVWGKERTLEICRGIKGLGIKWGCLSRADHLDEELLKAMAEAGCRYIDVGVESFNQRVLDYVKKDLKAEEVMQKIEMIKRHGIEAKLNMLLGACPFETKESIKESIAKAKQLKPTNIMFSIVNPFPGTEFYDECKKNGWLVGGEYKVADVQKKAITKFPNLGPAELNKLLEGANYGFYFSPSFVLANLKRLLSPQGFSTTLRALRRKLTF